MLLTATYRIVCSYLNSETGWVRDSSDLTATRAAADAMCENFAALLEREHGGTHGWTVRLYADNGDCLYELFHGRLR